MFQMWQYSFKYTALLVLTVSSLSASVASSQDLTSDSDSEEGLGSHSTIQKLIGMSEALERQSYQGTLTYEFGGPLETLAFEKNIASDGGYERIRHLSGKSRDFLRDLPNTSCKNAASRLLFSTNKPPLSHITKNYSFKSLGQNRIADRPVDIVQIKPLRADRYGFTLAIDKESSLPLMMTITGGRGQVLERFQFVEFSLGPTMREQQSWRKVQQLPLALHRCDIPEQPEGWKPRWLPAGYVLASASSSIERTRLNYTDGLSSLSVFVVPATKASGAVGVVQRGATVAAMNLVAIGDASFKVSIVGEVPPAVARKIAASVGFEAQ